MQQQNNNDKQSINKMEQPGHGPQGVDKAPVKKQTRIMCSLKRKPKKVKKLMLI